MTQLFNLASSLLLTAAMGWAPTGVNIAGPYAGGPLACPDGAQGVFVCWDDERDLYTTLDDAYGAHVRSSGVLDPAFPSNGLPIAVTARDETDWGVARAFDGGAYWLWSINYLDLGQGLDLHLRKTLATTAPDPAWPADGISFGATADDIIEPKMVEDQQGGVFVGWEEGPDSSNRFLTHTARATRVLPDGSVAPGWPAAGVVFSTGYAGRTIQVIAADGGGGGFFVWYDSQDSVSTQVYAQHLLANGSVAPGWPAGGARVCALHSAQDCRSAIPDGAGGL